NESRINELRQSVLKNIDNLIYASKLSLQDIDKRIDDITKTGNKLPEAQRKLIGYERKFKLNDALYTYLLTKRSETQIAKASYLPDNEVLDEASTDEFRMVYPNTHRNYLIALLLGLGVPAAFLLLREYFNTKVQADEDIEKVTDFPILGHVVRNKETSRSVVTDYPMSLTAESIRAIRTNFQFVAKAQEHNTIVLTSSIKGEGKSFTALNIALSLGLNDKKTVLINFDLRRPRLQDYLGVESEDKGLSAYLSGNADLDEIILSTKFSNLDAIMAGVIPPNPMELIAGQRTKVLFEELKNRYDYILVDTPPIGMVADALLLLNYSDVNIFIVRQNYTLKKVLAQLMQTLKKRGINNMNIVLNDIRLDHRYGMYNYGYAYNYGYGYIDENSPRKKIKKRIRKVN
ncbi:MAG TPA: polysaccharide biosynthesis tyrosine autokinase, partial [Bacteroidales bacterium]